MTRSFTPSRTGFWTSRRELLRSARRRCMAGTFIASLALCASELAAALAPDSLATPIAARPDGIR